MDVNYILAKVSETAKQFEEQFSRELFKRLQEVTTETGQVVNAAGRPLTNELMIEMLSKMRIDFEKSQHGDLAIVTAPGAASAFQRLEDEMKNDPEIRQRWTAMMEAKRNDFREREINRNLVG
jgi:hypothetical protein